MNEDGSEEQELEVRFSTLKSENRQRHLNGFRNTHTHTHTYLYETFKVWVKRKEGKQRVEVVARQVVIFIIATTTNIIIIITTRPKPAYGRKGLAGSWGQDTDEVSTFLVFLTSHFEPAALSSDLTNLGLLMTMKIHLETWKNHGNRQKP